MPTQTQAPTPSHLSQELFGDMQSRALEAFSAVADMNHRVLQELVGLSASTAKETLRTLAELQSATVEAARGAQGPVAAPEALDELRRNPLAWYQKSLLTLVDGTQTAFRLVEANAQVVTRSAERLQASADRTAHEIQETLGATVGRMKEIYGRS